MQWHRLWWGIPRLVLLVGLIALGALGALYAVALSGMSRIASASAEPDGHSTAFTLTSPDFAEGGLLPHRGQLDRFGCDGHNLAPTLRWAGVPPGTVSLALTMTDYDAPVAGGFHHWVVYDIPAHAGLMNGLATFTQGTNSYGLSGYGGPCPPATGQTHHYVFTLYALTVANLAEPALTYDELMRQIGPEVIGAAVAVGTLARR
jgi:Raf kinase inhibitor-like YbhB/YbcL family protein